MWPVFGVYGLCVNKTANPGSSMATFRSLQNAQSTRTANPGSSMATFRSLHQSGHKTANHGSSMATTFKIIFSPQNCKPWQFYGHFSESTKSGHKTASLGSSMATLSRIFILQFCIHSDYIHLKVAIELLGFAVLWPLFIDSEKWP